MALELAILGWAGVLAVVQLVLMAVPANLQLGSAYLVTARDEQRQLSGVPARLKRAYDNHIEGLVMFAVAALVVSVSGRSTGFTQGCAVAYLAARVVYIPLYAYGIPYVRSAVWAVGFFATLLMLLAVLL
ncbi:MAG: MAPEG family protein [Pseudomonadota bacterium]